MIAPDAPTLTAKSTYGPGVEILFSTVDGDAVSITVWRVADGITEAVAGALDATVSGAFVVTDWLVPQDVDVSYVGEITDATGASVSSLPSSVTVASNGSTWMSDVVDPSVFFEVTDFSLDAQSFAKITRKRDRRSIYVSGLSQPFIQDWGLRAIEGLPLRVQTKTDADALTFRNVAQSPQLAIRTPLDGFVLLPRLLYASVGEPTPNPEWASGLEHVTWVIDVDEVQPVSKAILRPLVTWDDWTAAFPVVRAEWSGAPYLSASTFEGATNLHTRPNPGQDDTGYAVFASGGGQTFSVTVPATGGLNGLGYWRATGSGANSGAAGFTLGPALNVSLGDVVTVGAWVRVSASSVVVEMAIGTYTAVDGGGTRVTATGDDFSSTADEWMFIHFTYTVTSGIASIRPYVRLRSAGAVQAGRTFDFDQLSLADGTEAADFTGDSFTGSSWDDVVSLYAAGTWIDAVRNPPSA